MLRKILKVAKLTMALLLLTTVIVNANPEVSAYQIMDGSVSQRNNIEEISNVEGQQQKSVSGTVTDNSGEPLPGVTVVVKGTTQGTVTNADGNYSLASIPEDATLVFSFVGMRTQEIEVSNQTNINVTMEQDFIGIDEVVAVGYGTMRKSDLTGSVVSIKSEELNTDKRTSFIESMQGRMAGVQIRTQSGEPGAGIDVKIRGINSVYGSSQPLYVIDGVQIDANSSEIASAVIENSATMNPLLNMNTADIESIEILKDASATAIYGSRGANGVVLITTKSGQQGRTKIIYDGSVSVSQAKNSIDFVGIDDYIAMRREKQGSGAWDFLLNEDTDGDGSVDSPRDLSSLEEVDWFNKLMRTAITNQHNLSISGGDNKTTFAGNLGYLDQQGTVRGDGLKRYNVKLSLNHKFSNKFNFKLNLTPSYSEKLGAASPGFIIYTTLRQPFEFFDQSNNDDLILGRYVSPVSMVEEAYNFTSVFSGLGNTVLEYEIIKNLKLRAEGGANISHSKGKEFYGKYTNFGARDDGRAVIQDRKKVSWFARAQANYLFNINKIHSFNLTGVYELNRYNFERFLLEGANFPDESTGVDDVSKAGETRRIESERWDNNRVSYLGRVNYNFKKRYYFTGSLRVDGSDKFGSGNQYGFFPSGAFSWRISEEGFLKNNSTLSNLKLRLSYGVTGNERIDAYAYLASLQNAWYASDNNLMLGLAPASRENPDLKWETTSQYNAGMDIGFLDNRIALNADVYYKKTALLI